MGFVRYVTVPSLVGDLPKDATFINNKIYSNRVQKSSKKEYVQKIFTFDIFITLPVGKAMFRILRSIKGNLMLDIN